MKLLLLILGGIGAAAGGVYLWRARAAAGTGSPEGVPDVPETIPQTAAGQAEATLKRGQRLTLKSVTGAVPGVSSAKPNAKRSLIDATRPIAKAKLRAWIQKGRTATG